MCCVVVFIDTFELHILYTMLYRYYYPDEWVEFKVFFTLTIYEGLVQITDRVKYT